MNLGTATTLADGKLTYHSTVVCEALPDNKTRLNSGGWRTATTKKRMNQYAEAMGFSWRILQHNGDWMIVSRGLFGKEARVCSLEFYDDIEVKNDEFQDDMEV